MNVIDINEKQNVAYCIPTELRDEQIKINLRKVKERFKPSEELKDEPIAVVAFAPSLNETWEELKKFKYIMTCSGAHKFLVEKGIIPTWHVDLEPRIHKIKLLGQPQKETEYLIASTVHPKYLDALQGHNVKLWHIFSNDEEAIRVLPKGEWQVTGGSSVGLRCMTLARLLGFTELHIFGMDGNAREGSGAHTTEHPNAPKEYSETEYNGKKYLTTPSILFCAKETFKELDQMPDVKATFYGEGLVQDMAKDYKRSPKRQSEIAYNKPELISEEYVNLNRKLHEDNPSYGMGGSKHAKTILEIVNTTPDIKSILDYGCGKGMLAKNIPFPIWEYDPAIPEKSTPPKPADLVVCTDVLEHIEPEKLAFVLDDLRRCVKQVGYFVISTRQAVKKYANGRNAHLIVQTKDWWEKTISKFFDIAKVFDVTASAEVHLVVAPKKVKQPDTTSVERNGKKYNFYTENETTKWRANSLFTKEPSTIEWLESLKAGEVLYDIGANIGSYSVFGGVNGLRVFAFEPEAENYATLVRNMILNKIEPNAYCLALSNEEKIGTLYAGQAGAGGACHSFNEKIGHDLKERGAVFTQGSFGIPLDSLVERGLPSPDHIKIDVDGLEYKVIEGAQKTLETVKSVLIEINTNLPEHQEMIEKIKSLGFTYDPAQVERATRKEGSFKGVAEFIFTKRKLEISYPTVSVKPTVTYYGDMEKEPYNYLYTDNMLNKDLYDKLTDYIKTAKYTEIEKSRGTKGYPLRYTTDAPDFIKKALLDGVFKKSLLHTFGIKDEDFVEDLLLVRDLPGYSIPPHTDSLRKVITLLMYLPSEDGLEKEGTSIFIPKKRDFICKTGQHHKFEDFYKVKTMPFKPNSAFIFARTDNSFHGVEPCNHVRDVLLYNINRK